MHGCSLGCALLVNAEVDSMGEVLVGGVGIGTKTSPERAAIEKAQAELREEHDVREERRRELEFLEKGGNPLDFRFGNAASVSVQSTSLTDQPPEHYVTSEAKGSFALTASPHGDSVESSGRPGAPTVYEPNCADNLLLFDGESESIEDERNSVYPTQSNVAPSAECSQFEGNQNAKQSGDLTGYGLPKNRSYKRRNRSRPNRDGARSSSSDMVPSRGGYVSSLPSCHGPKDVKGSIHEANKQKEKHVSSYRKPKPTSPNGGKAFNALTSAGQVEMVLEKEQVIESTTGLPKISSLEPLSHSHVSKSLQDDQLSQHLQAAGKETNTMAFGGPESVCGKEGMVSAGVDYSFCTVKDANQSNSSQPNGCISANGDAKTITSKGQHRSAAFRKKAIESSRTQTNVSLYENKDSDLCNNLRDVNSNGNSKEENLILARTPNMEGGVMVKEKNEQDTGDGFGLINEKDNSVSQSRQSNGSAVRAEEELHGCGSGSQNKVKSPDIIEGVEVDDNSASGMERKPGNSVVDYLNPQTENYSSGRLKESMDSCSNLQNENASGSPHGSMEPHIPGLSEIRLPLGDSTDAPKPQDSSESHIKLSNKAREDSILEEARIIEAKRRRIAELSVGTLPSENHQKSRWNFVLQEMAWLANDFAQERIWKITAAAYVSNQIAYTSRLRFQEQNIWWKQKKLAHTLAKAIMEFWHSAEERSKEVELVCSGSEYAVQGYSLRFLKYNSSLVPPVLAEAPATPDRISDLGIQELSWEDYLTEENLFYTVPPGAVETYRKSIETHLEQVEKIGSNLQEKVETSLCDASTDNTYEEDEGETSTYYLPGGFEGNKPSKFAQRKRKNVTKSHAAKPYDLGTDSPFTQCMENGVGNQHSVVMGKRHANSLNAGSVPTKRMRTASRPRVLSPFSPGMAGDHLGPNKTDASSGDTSSFQDDHSMLHCGSHIPNGMEVESFGDFDMQSQLNSTEVSKPRKKKKAKHLGSTCEQTWQLRNNFQNEQREYSKKRLHSHQLEANGSCGLFGQNNIKKSKLMRQSLDNSFGNLTPMLGSITSPAASQMSNMPNPNKLFKILGVRDRGRKLKSLKMPAGHPGSESPWSLFEDQALVVLVHDLGPNWELVSDAINSTLQLKCMFRKAKDCKLRHNILMDRTAGDGVDSADDSGPSHPYPSTLPGIPKGSARQLFQRLQGPMVEELIKTHFEKILMISQKHNYRGTQNDNQDSKPIQPHNSHALALSEVCPNNLNGGPPLTPLNLCETTASSPDNFAVGYHGSHASGLAISNQASVASVLPPSVPNSPLQGSSNMVLGNNLSSPSGPHNALVRDGRNGVPRPPSILVDEQKRLQQHNQMLSVSNIQQPSLSISGAPPGTDCGVRMLPGGNGMGIMSGMNRSMPMARPGFRGIASTSMLNCGSMISSSMAAMPSPVNMQPGVGSGQGNSMLRPQESLQMMRPGQNPEHQRQMTVPEIQMQMTQGNSQVLPPFGGLGSGFSNQMPAQTHPLHQQQQQQQQMSLQQSHGLRNSQHPRLQGPNLPSSPQNQAYAIRYAKERQLTQRLPQQHHHQQFAASNALMPHVQPQYQLPVSCSPQNSSQVQPQPSSTPVSLPSTQSSPSAPVSQHQPKLHMPPHGLNRNPQTGGNGLTNQMVKQRHRQLQQQQQQQSFHQSGRQHPQQWEQSQSQQQAKHIKGVGKGNVLMHQSRTIDPSLLNGFSTNLGSQSAEKTEQVMHLIQGQGFYPGSGLNPVQPSNPLRPPHSSDTSHPQQMMYSGKAIHSSKQVQQMPSNLDNSNEGHAAPATLGHTLSASHQAVMPSVMASSNHQQLQTRQKLVNLTQPTVQRVFQHNPQLNCDPPNKLQADEDQADQQRVSNPSPTGRSTSMQQANIDTSSEISVMSTSCTRWKASDQMHDSGFQNPAMQLPPIESPTAINSAGSEPTPAVSQGLGQGKSSGNLSPVGHTNGAQWHQQQQSQLSLPSAPPPEPQERQQLWQQSPQQKLPDNISISDTSSQQQTIHLPVGNSNSYIRPGDSSLE